MVRILIPQRMQQDLEKIRRDFLSGPDECKKKVYFFSWQAACLPPHSGGLGIRDLEMMNLAMLGKRS